MPEVEITERQTELLARAEKAITEVIPDVPFFKLFFRLSDKDYSIIHQMMVNCFIKGSTHGLEEARKMYRDLLATHGNI